MVVEHVDHNQPNQTVQQDIVEKVEQQLGVQVFDFVVREVAVYQVDFVMVRDENHGGQELKEKDENELYFEKAFGRLVIGL